MLVVGLLEQRQQARAAKDFATADALRDRIKAAGIEVEDGPSGSTWSTGLETDAAGTDGPPNTRHLGVRRRLETSGNSSRKGAIRKTSKGSTTAGFGGRVKRGLEGRGPTPKAAERENDKAYKAKKRSERDAPKSAPRRSKGGDTEWIAGRNGSSRRCGPRCP